MSKLTDFIKLITGRFDNKEQFDKMQAEGKDRKKKFFQKDRAGKMDKEKLKKLRRSDFFKAVFLIIFVFVTGWVIFGFTRVYGSAMKPAACDGDILMYYRLHTEYKAGDMVVYQADGLLHIGRIAAVPEETVQITEEGELVINRCRCK